MSGTVRFSPWAIALLLFSGILAISANEGVWVSHNDLELARADVAAVSYDGNIYVFGGSRLDPESEEPIPGQALDTLVRYNPATQEHTMLASMPEPRYRMGYAELDGKIYLFQGYDTFYAYNITRQATLVYDIANDEWSQISANVEPLRSDLCAASINGKIYAFGGYTAQGNSGEIDVFDPDTQEWTQVPAQLQKPRGDCAALTVNGKIYVMGGQEYDPPGHDSYGANCSAPAPEEWYKCYAFSGAVEVFDPSDNTVTEVASMKTGRADFGAAVSPDGHILVAGGEIRDPSSDNFRLLATRTVELYNMTSGEWKDMAPLPVGKFRTAMATAQDLGILVGGVPSCVGDTEKGNETECYVEAKKAIHAFHFDSSTLDSQDGSSAVSVMLTGVGFDESDYNDKTQAFMDFKADFEEELERKVTLECGCQPEASITSVTFASRKSRRSVLDSHDVTVDATVNDANSDSTTAALNKLEGGSLAGYTVTGTTTDGGGGGGGDGGDGDAASSSHLSACLTVLLGTLAAFLA